MHIILWITSVDKLIAELSSAILFFFVFALLTSSLNLFSSLFTGCIMSSAQLLLLFLNTPKGHLELVCETKFHIPDIYFRKFFAVKLCLCDTFLLY